LVKAYSFEDGIALISGKVIIIHPASSFEIDHSAFRLTAIVYDKGRY
jgi:hypothetical protein